MNPLIILQLIQAVLVAAPQAVELVAKAKDLITALFTAKVITKAQQDAMHLHIDALAALNAAGIIPPAWQVDPDPE